MQPWSETLQFSAPLVNLRLAHCTAASEPSQERLRERFEEGVREGEKRLRERLLQQRAELLALQRGVLQSLSDCLPQVRAECEAALVKLALAAAEKLVAGLPITAEMVEAAVKEALGHVQSAHDLTVLLHAEDLALLQDVNSPTLLAEIGGEKISFQASPEVTRGGCMVHTRFGLLDARRETKLELLKSSLNS